MTKKRSPRMNRAGAGEKPKEGCWKNFQQSSLYHGQRHIVKYQSLPESVPMATYLGWPEEAPI